MSAERDDDTLTPQQHNAIVALMTEPTIAKVAKVAGCSDRTIYRWLDEPAFADAYRQARRKAIEQSTARLQQASAKAVNVLVGLMTSTRTPAAVRLAAASKILDLAYRGVDVDELAQRLAALESSYAVQNPSQTPR